VVAENSVEVLAAIARARTSPLTHPLGSVANIQRLVDYTARPSTQTHSSVQVGLKFPLCGVHLWYRCNRVMGCRYELQACSELLCPHKHRTTVVRSGRNLGFEGGGGYTCPEDG